MASDNGTWYPITMTKRLMFIVKLKKIGQIPAIIQVLDSVKHKLMINPRCGNNSNMLCFQF